MSFVHLHCHSEYSLGDSTARIKDYIEAAKKAGMNALALSDTNSIAGAFTFSILCKDNSIKAIIASELSLKGGSIVCIAMNEKGMNNLAMLVSLSRNKHGLSLKNIKYHNEGLICLSGCMLANKLISGDSKKARSLAIRFKSFFKDRFYIELQDHGKAEDKVALPLLKKLADELEIECVCTNDVHYIKKNDADAYDTLCCIRNGKKKNAPVPEGEYFFKSTDEMKDLFSWCPEALNNTSRIAELCTLDFCEYEKSRLEHPYPEIHQNPDEYLAALVNTGLKKRFETITDEINDRLKAEMETIKEKGWTDFFIIVHDVVSWVRKEGITIVPGRWKYVSSLVCYLLEITDINPLEYGLISEDFINKKSCINHIDISVAASPEGKARIIGYLKSEYGEYGVGYAGYFYNNNDIQSIVVSQVASVYGCSDFSSRTMFFSLEEFVAGLKIWNTFSGNTVKHTASFIESVRKINGLKSGYIFDDSPEIIWSSQNKTFPLIENPDYDMLTADYDMYSPAQTFRIVTLYYQKWIDDAQIIIRKRHDPDFNIREINLSDEKVFGFLVPREPYNECYMIFAPVEKIVKDHVMFFDLDYDKPYFWEVLEKIKPQNISELAAAIALSFHYAEPLFDILDIDAYIKKQKVFNPDLSEILKDTNGHIIFEEQKVHAISVLFESTIDEALYAFRSIYEESESIIDALKKEYIEKAVEKGIEQQNAEKTFYIIKYIMKYKKRLPLKAECIPCAIETYQLAYIATYYPEVANEVFNF